MRSCAYSIEALNNCVDSENQAPESIKKHLSNICLKVSSNSSCVIKELAKTIKTLKKSSSIDFLVEEMSGAVQDLQNEIKSLPNLLRPAELLLPKSKETEKTTSRNISPGSYSSTEFKAEDDDKAKQNQANMNRIVPSQQDDDRQTEKALERV
ncbi:hypothetical protein OIU84_003898 [Salix udensis]|uniref:Uncharacterized protein n=1 Tax=Salix udensis TaxID=889485 RepID=A0AAD6P3C8_9ROSI|nr:hypothetical protein OIU84_003898 [Salix udensis]